MSNEEKTKVVVTNISPVLQESQLKELFSAWGAISKIDLVKIGLGDERICHIEYVNPQNAKNAPLLNGTNLGDRKLVVTLVSADTPLPSAAPTVMPSAPLLPLSAAAPALLYPTMVAPPLVAMQAMAANPALATSTLAVTTQKRADEVSRTVYVGNIGPMVDENALKAFFSSCGEVLFVKINGDGGNGVRYAFVEFREQTYANTALSLSGAQLGDRAIKVGRANNPILKNTAGGTMISPSPISALPTGPTDPLKAQQALQRVREAQMMLNQKLSNPTDPRTSLLAAALTDPNMPLAPKAEEKQDEKSEKDKEKDKDRKRSRSRSRRRSRSRSRSRRRSRSRSRDRSRGRDRDRSRRHRSRRSRSPRDRSRDRHRRRDSDSRSRRRSRSRSRSRDRKEKPEARTSPARPPRPSKQKQPDRTGQFWDGFQWHPLPNINGAGVAAAPPADGVNGTPQ